MQRSRATCSNPRFETDGKPTSVKIGALQVWQKQDGTWALLARQGFKLA